MNVFFITGNTAITLDLNQERFWMGDLSEFDHLLKKKWIYEERPLSIDDIIDGA